MKRFLLYLSALFVGVSFATAQTTYEISASTGTLTGGTNPSYEWVSNQVDLTLRATNDGGDVKNISYISNGTKLSLNAYNSKGGYYATTYTISVPQDGDCKIAGYNISATAYKTVIVNGVEYTNGNAVSVENNNVNDYEVSFTVERKKNSTQSTSAAAIDINSFTVTLQKVEEGEGEGEGGEEPGDDSAIMEQYDAIAKPTFGTAGNTTFVKAATLAGDVNAEVAGIQAIAGQACVTNVIEVAAGAEFDLNITYQLNWGDLAIYQIENGEATKEYGYYEGSWELNGSTAKVAQNIAEDGISVTEVVDEVCTATFPISINENHNPGDVIVVRAITGVKNDAKNSAFEQNIVEGGYVDFLFVVTEETAEKSYTLTVGETEWATLYLDFAVTIPAGVEVYTVTKVNDGYVTLAQVTGVLPANTGVIVKAAENDYTFAYSTDEAADVTGNLLKGTVTDKNIEGEAYVLGVVDGEVGLYKALANGTSWLNNANKAYLPMSAVANKSAEFFGFDWDGTTAIENVEVENASNVIYDLTGRKVNEITAPGIYIVGGKKVLVK